jgi:transposase InsO family protein
MVGPARKREAVGHLQSELELSQRRACKVVGQPRATQRHTPQPDAAEDRLRARLNEFSRQRPRAGYRTACGQFRQEGMRVNPKRVQRLWREEGLKVPRKQCKKRRLGTSENGSQRRVATQPNEVWSYDFVSDQTSDGRRLKFLCVVDEFTRECLALAVRRSFRAKDVMAVLAGLIAQRGVPAHLRSDNGPEFVAKAVQAWLKAHAVGPLHIAPGSPWENAYVESFNSRLRDEHLNREEFASLLEAEVLAAGWRRDYNEARPHSSLEYLAPAVFAARWRAPVGASPLPAHASAEQPKP